MVVAKNNNKSYRVHFKNMSLFDKERLKKSRCILSISVGQPYHEGEKFEATVKLINKYFKECIVLLGDTLQRHTIGTFQYDKSEQMLYETSLTEGEEWLNRNGSVMHNHLKIPYRIARWDLLFNDEFDYFHAAVIDLCIRNAEFADSLNQTTKEFLIRAKNRVCNLDTKKLIKHSSDYLLEECAALQLWPEFGCEFEVYPSERNLAIKFIYDKCINAYEEIMIPLSMSFHKIPQTGHAYA